MENNEQRKPIEDNKSVLQKEHSQYDQNDTANSDNSIETLAQIVADNEKSDIFLFNGVISSLSYHEILKVVAIDKSADRCILMITTYGGTAEDAYKIARWFQRFYPKFVVFPTSLCASAGTLIAIGASQLIMSPFSQLSPLDVQLPKLNELGERKSGMVTRSALSILEKSAFNFWQYFMLEIKLRGYGNITFETCAKIATRICSTVFSEMYKQIDPDILGQDERDLSVAFDYGTRLASVGNNISEESIDKLVKGYSSHDFVIDAEEATTLFNQVDASSEDLFKLTSALREETLSPKYNDFIVKRLATYHET